MEKLVYLVWKHETQPIQAFSEQLRTEIPRELLALGARKLRVSVVDEAVNPAGPVRVQNSKPPFSGMVSIWVDSAHARKPLESQLEGATARLAGYLVAESEPLINTRFAVPEGERTPGWNQIALLRTPPRLSREAWINIWLEEFAAVAMGTQSIFGYRRNLVVRPLTYAAPPYDGIGEENFPAAAMTDTMVKHDAVGDEEKLQRNQTRLIEEASRFIDWDKVDTIATSEYTIKS